MQGGYTITTPLTTGLILCLGVDLQGGHSVLYSMTPGWQRFWEWIFPIVIMVGATLTAHDIYPWNKWLFLVGNGGLTIMCALWRRWSLVGLNGYLALTYLVGLLLH